MTARAACALLVLTASGWPLAAVQAQMRPSGPDRTPPLSAVADAGLDPTLNEQVLRLPLTVRLIDGTQRDRDFVLTIFKPPGAGPFPTVIASHGRRTDKRAEFGRSRLLRYYFVRRGFAVLAPTRIGYGVSGYDIDPERSNGPPDNCDAWRYEPLAVNVRSHIEATIAYARQQPWVDSRRLLLAGVSAGGFGSLVAAGDIAGDLTAVVNFAGGIGGLDRRPERPCNPGDVELRLAAAARKRPLPTIWLYSENDRLWGARIPQDWHSAYVNAGGLAEFHMLAPLGENGHDVIDPGVKLWRPMLDRFLTRLGFAPRKPPSGAPPPSDFAELEDVARLPLVNDKGREGYRAFLQSDVPRAYAIGPNGAWAWVGGNMTALESVLARCREFAKTSCTLYAVNDDVVWKP